MACQALHHDQAMGVLPPPRIAWQVFPKIFRLEKKFGAYEAHIFTFCFELLVVGLMHYLLVQM